MATHPPKRVSASVTGAGTTTVTTLQIARARARTVLVRRLRVERTAGSGTTYQPTLHESSGGDTKASISSTAVATVTDHLFDPPVPMVTNTSGQLFLETNFDAGTDNDFDYEIDVDLLHGIV